MTGRVQQRPEAAVQRVHSTCGRPVLEASLGLDDLFDGVGLLCSVLRRPMLSMLLPVRACGSMQRLYLHVSASCACRRMRTK